MAIPQIFTSSTISYKQSKDKGSRCQNLVQRSMQSHEAVAITATKDGKHMEKEIDISQEQVKRDLLEFIEEGLEIEKRQGGVLLKTKADALDLAATIDCAVKNNAKVRKMRAQAHTP
jgi:biotin operon repressor